MNTDDAPSKQPPEDNPMAAVALLVAILAWPMLGLTFATDEYPFISAFIIFVFIIFGLIAMLCARRALLKISGTLREVKGCRMAKTALWLGCIEALILPVLASVAIPLGTRTSAVSYKTKAINNARQVITYLKLYSSDHDGEFPDADKSKPATSNDAFRVLFIEGSADNEIIFGSPVSPFQPDGNIGSAPDYREAVKASENHWAMTKGLTDEFTEHTPLIYENPVDATWPPKWDPTLAGKAKPGRTWSGGKIIVGFIDASVEALPTESPVGNKAGLKPRTDGTSYFPAARPGLEVLNVAR